jgi:ABC-type Fe3+-siderophore transport system permease subunit
VGVGHAAVAPGAARIAPRVNAGWLVFAALLAGAILGLLVARMQRPDRTRIFLVVAAATASYFLLEP